MRINGITKVKGIKNGQPFDIRCSSIVMGSGDFLREDNLSFAGSLLDEFVSKGGDTFDTARHYRHSEKALGIWMAERDNRKEVNILTKCCHPVRGALDIPRVTPEAIEEDLQESLRLLQTDHVELLALHRDDESKPVGPLMEKLHQVVLSGRAYSIGLSNWELPRIIEAQEYCLAHGLTPLSFNSPNLSLAKVNKPRWADCVSANNDMIAWHEQTNLPLFSWSSQAGGLYSGAYGPDKLDNEEMVDVYYNDENWLRYDRAKELAAAHGVSSIQISLAYVLNQTFPTTAIIGAENKEEMNSSILASDISLTKSEVDYLDLRTNDY